MNQDAKKAYQEAQASALATLPLLEQALSVPADADRPRCTGVTWDRW